MALDIGGISIKRFSKVPLAYPFIANMPTDTILLAQTHRETWWNQALIDIEREIFRHCNI